ncbi:DUF421 domain-containing protein [Halorussus limi]|uniref:DUF421 domain-containing protein n=2 Tax=Halorussus TaxID=1070314 RepID=A0A8U0IGU2_9EURY|nr:MULTISPECIES: YetF domain-containing protein [Halorussus]UPV73888.1 DUF421 domain-containing protein [Halorussus limi]UPV99905.1 DUF421 domain-containing protein [Halorussus gelatinilyticus]
MSSVNFFFAGWETVLRVIVVGIAMYVSLVVFLRLSGSRTIASMNVFDFIVTVALGAVFGRALTANSVALAEALTAFALLIVLQYTVAWLQTRWPRFEQAVTNDSTLLYFHGEFLQDAMRDQRVTENELRGAVQKENVGSMDEVEALVLESDGKVLVITSVGDGSTLGRIISDERTTQSLSEP